MDHQSIFNIQTLFSHISDLPFHILDSTEAELTCIDGGLRTHFKDSAQMYEDWRDLLNEALSPDTVLHVHDAFCLHYVIFQPDAASTHFCVLGPFAENSADHTHPFIYIQQLIHLPVFSADSVLGAVRSIFALLPESSSKTIRNLLLRDDPALLVRLAADFPEDVEPVIQQLVYYIQTHLHEKLSLQSLSEHFGFSPTYISHRFKEALGLPPMQYIIHQRLFHAQNLLRTTDKPVKEIADAVGIADYSYFTKLFRDHTGATPSQYRSTYR